MGTSDTARSSLRSIKKDYRAIARSGEGLQSSDSGQSFQLREIWILKDPAEYSRSINGYGTCFTARDCLGCGTPFEKLGLLGTYLLGSICQRRAFLVIDLPSWWELQTKFAEGRERQPIPLLPVWCQYQRWTPRAWRRITDQQENTWRTAQRNSTQSSH